MEKPFFMVFRTMPEKGYRLMLYSVQKYNMVISRNFNFFISKFYFVAMLFFKRNFFGQPFKLNISLFNPKMSLYYYFNSLKFFGEFRLLSLFFAKTFKNRKLKYLRNINFF